MVGGPAHVDLDRVSGRVRFHNIYAPSTSRGIVVAAAAAARALASGGGTGDDGSTGVAVRVLPIHAHTVLESAPRAPVLTIVQSNLPAPRWQRHVTVCRDTGSGGGKDGELELHVSFRCGGDFRRG